MIRFNLLPWRDASRRQRKRDFAGFLMLAALLGVAMVLVVSALNASALADQAGRMGMLKTENALLDTRISEIAGLRQDIETLRARQTAVETLQSNRNQPVYLMDEFSALVPAGVVLKSIKQADNIVVTGYAQSNARVSEFLRKLNAQGRWLVQPDFIEIKSASVGQGKDLRKIVEFTLTVGLARPSPETP